MAEKTDSAKAIFPPVQVAWAVNRWRRMYDPYVKAIGPYVKLFYLLKLAMEAWLAQRTAFTACLEGFPPFRIEITRLDSFLPRHSSNLPGRPMRLSRI